MMNLLPKSREEFIQKDYWDSFFKKRGSKAFEWYGEYPELCDHLHKYIKPKDDVIIVGCGNSSLGNDLYDIGYKNITSIDISPVAIRQMNNLNQKLRPELKFFQMDALNMSFADESFTVVLDKGTLDALMPDDTPETCKTIKQYFDEIIRVLKIGGRYICISLLQEHILKVLLEYFPSQNCMFRIVRCFEAEKNAAEQGESSMPVFMIVCTKFKALPMKVLELNLCSTDRMQRISDEAELQRQVLVAQNSAFICSGLKRTTVDDDVLFDLFQPGQETARYTVYVVDIQADRKNLQYAAFIVPQGRESEWLFSTKEGRKELAVMSKCKRLTVVTLHRGQTYENLDVVKSELGDVVRNFAPSTLGSDKIPFLSLGADVGERTIRYEGSSKCSGDYIIEDVLINGEKFRRLYYSATQLVIQSEAKLKSVKSRGGHTKEIIDATYLTCEHHIPMSRAVHMAVNKIENTQVAIIGLGGGSLCSFLRKFLPKVNLTAVDIDPDMLTVGKEWFGLKLDNYLKVHIMDGLDFLKQHSISEEKFDAILFDVDSKDSTIGMSCPPKEFLADNVLQDVFNCLKPTGLFILNAVVRDATLRPGIVNSLNIKFPTVASIKLQKDLNEIFIGSIKELSKNFLKNAFKEATTEINKFFIKHNNKDLFQEYELNEINK